MTAVILEKPSTFIIFRIRSNKMVSKFVILSLLGFLCLQISHCYEVLSVPSAMIPISPSIFYDDSGNPILSSYYPYYNYFSFRAPSSLVDDYNVNQQLSLDSAIYNVPLSDLYQLYNLIENNMPNLPTNMELSMMQDLAKAIQDEKTRQYLDPYQYKLNPQSNPSLALAQLMGYTPSDLPPAYVYMLSYLDSLVPPLSSDGLVDIQNAVYNNIPNSFQPKADDLTFQLQTAIRYMRANEMRFLPSY